MLEINCKYLFQSQRTILGVSALASESILEAPSYSTQLSKVICTISPLRLPDASNCLQGESSGSSLPSSFPHQLSAEPDGFVLLLFLLTSSPLLGTFTSCHLAKPNTTPSSIFPDLPRLRIFPSSPSSSYCQEHAFGSEQSCVHRKIQALQGGKP